MDAGGALALTGEDDVARGVNRARVSRSRLTSSVLIVIPGDIAADCGGTDVGGGTDALGALGIALDGVSAVPCKWKRMASSSALIL